MSPEITLFSAFMMGLLGSGHCVGMCGGITVALTSGARPEGKRGLPLYLLLYNLGRIMSYAAAGALAGTLGFRVLDWIGMERAHVVASLVSGLFLVGVGLYISGWWRGLSVLEKAGAVLWRRVEPVGRRLLPVRSLPQALLAGLLWGWLPCGLVYTALAWALVAGDTYRGAALMLFFGLGTLPMMLLVGGAFERFSRWLRAPRARQFIGGLMILAGLAVSLGLHMGDHNGHGAHSGQPDHEHRHHG